MVFCTNCQSEIDDNKIFLHEGFCKKNIKYCFKCHEKIPIEEYDEHLESHNTKKTKNEKTEKKEEKEENVNIECQYCSLLLDQSELEEHEKMCGARTVPCEVCGKYIQTRLIKQHMNVLHDLGYKDIYNDNESKEDSEKYKKECEKRKQIEDDEILARKLAEEYRNYDMFNSRFF
jgi:hypothetical protein